MYNNIPREELVGNIYSFVKLRNTFVVIIIGKIERLRIRKRMCLVRNNEGIRLITS